jgi:fructose-1,6-bisphosphatase I
MPAMASSLTSRRSPALAGATHTARRVHRSVGRAPAPARRCVVETRAKLGESLSSYLSYQSARGEIDGDLAIALNSVAIACKRVRALVASAPLAGNTGSAGGAANASGDEQKKLDVLANDVFVESLRACGRASVIVTEEEDVPVAVERAIGDYIVTFDPIDGSSNIDACVPTGSIFGVYAPGECDIADDDNPEQIMEKCLTNAKQSGQQLVAAGYCMYSSACVFVLSTGDGVHQFEYDANSGEFIMSEERMMLPDGDRMQSIFSGNLGNVELWAKELQEYVTTLQERGWAYRYIGALIGDFHRVLRYGGIWIYPPDKKAPEGKARLLYEVAPISFLAKQAGGMAVRGDKATEDVLDVVPTSIHQKSPMFVGSASAVKDLQEFLKKY